MRLLRCSLGDGPVQSFPLDESQSYNLQDLVCRRVLKLPEELLSQVDSIEIYYDEYGQRASDSPLPRVPFQKLYLSGVYRVVLPTDLLEIVRSNSELSSRLFTHRGERKSRRWRSPGDAWTFSVNVTQHPPAAALLPARARLVKLKVTALSSPSSGCAEVQVAHAICSRHFQRAMFEKLVAIREEGPDLELVPVEGDGKAEEKQSFLEYLSIGKIVLEIEKFAGGNSLLLKTSGEEKSLLHGYVVDPDFILELAKKELGELLNRNQLALVLDIDETILTTFHGCNGQRPMQEHMHPHLPLKPGTQYIPVSRERLAGMPCGQRVHLWFSDGSGRVYATAVRDAVYKVLHLQLEGKYRIFFMTCGSQDYGQRALQAVRCYLMENCDPGNAPEILNTEILSSVFSGENVVSVHELAHFLYKKAPHLENWGPKSFKQLFVFASFPEFHSKRILGVDDTITHLSRGRGFPMSSNYDPEDRAQVRRIPRMVGTTSSMKPEQQQSWDVMYRLLCDVHQSVTSTDGVSVKDALSSDYGTVVLD